MRLHGTLLGLLLMALAAAVFAYTLGFPAMPGQRYGPALFPQVICGGLFVCGAFIAWRAWRDAKALRRSQGLRTPLLALDPALRGARQWLSFASMPLAIGFYLLVAPRLGFLPTAALIVGALAAWFGVRLRWALLLGVGSSLSVNWFFGSLMRVPLPRGWFMQFLFGG